MAAPKNNQFWKLRSKHGRDKLFASPSLLWEAACEYFEHTDSRKWVEDDWVGKDAKKVQRKKATPYTLSGFRLYVGATRNWWDEFKKTANDDFLGVISRIEEIIYTQKFEGASVGAFNANIISRELGLADKKEIVAEVAHKIDLTKLSDAALEELEAIADNGGPGEGGEGA